MSGWQPIETAPTYLDVLVYDPHPLLGRMPRMASKRGLTGVWSTRDGHYTVTLHPTHWMPLPDPPSPLSAAQDRDQ